MKQRTTFIINEPSAAHPNNFELSSSSLHVKSLLATREDRLTIAFDELPVETWQADLHDYREFHVHWDGGRFDSYSDPYGSRLPAGLHVFTAPVESKDENDTKTRETLEAMFGIAVDVAIDIPALRHFYAPLSSLDTFSKHLKNLICPASIVGCELTTAPLESMASLSLRYDSISQTLSISALHPRPSKPWSGAFKSSRGDIEIGVLGLNDKPPQEDGFTLSGLVTVVGSDEKLEPVMFQFPARHHGHTSGYTLETQRPIGLHPKLQLSIEQLKEPGSECTLNAYLTLPRPLFVDKYPLSNPRLLQSLNIRRLRDVNGEQDLEAPVWASDIWGSSSLFELSPDPKASHLNIEIPLHLRYHEPLLNRTLTDVKFAWPHVFWACGSEEWNKMGSNPFDRQNLGWEHLFPKKTMFYHLKPRGTGEGTWETLEVPVMNLRDAQAVKFGTVGIIVGGFLWVLWKAFKPVNHEKLMKRE